jgi:hypothetical protein
MEHVISSYLRKIWGDTNWLFEGQRGFRPRYLCESQVITVCQDIADSLDNGGRTDAIIIDFSKTFDLVLQDRLLTKIATSGVDSRVVAWMRDFWAVHRVKLEGQLSAEVRARSVVPARKCTGPATVPRIRK